MAKLLLVEDDLTYSRIVKTFLEKNGYEIQSVTKVKEAQNLIIAQKFDLIIADFRLPDGTGMELLQWVKEKHSYAQVVLITNYSDIRTAIKAMKLGAFEYITKPINPDELLNTVRESLAQKQAPAEAPKTSSPKTEKAAPKTKIPEKTYVIGDSIEAEKLEKHIHLVAPTDLSVLILGETGTGKEYVSQRIHEFSNRKNEPFVAIDCGALPKDLAGSELFGHVKGAFTGAVDNKTGHFEAAKGGTIFLDEIGNLSMEVQVQMLRAIQERKIRKVGGNQEIEIDVRVLAATNENLLGQASEGKFREDLYHRLNEFTLKTIPLRSRLSDLEHFVSEFLQESNLLLNKQVKGISQDVWDAFYRYDWPGNLRELKNIIKRAVLLTTGDKIEMEALPQDLLAELEKSETVEVISSTDPIRVETISTASSPYESYQEQIQMQEKELIQKVLKETRYNKSKSARILKIDRKTLYKKIEKYGLE